MFNVTWGKKHFNKMTWGKLAAAMGVEPITYKLAESNTRIADGGGGLSGANDTVAFRKPLQIAGSPDALRIRPLLTARAGTLAIVPVGNNVLVVEAWLTCPSGRKRITFGGSNSVMLINGSFAVASDWVTKAHLGLSSITDTSGIYISMKIKPQAGASLNFGIATVDTTTLYAGSQSWRFEEWTAEKPTGTVLGSLDTHGVMTYTGTAPGNVGVFPCIQVEGDYVTDTGHVAVTAVGMSMTHGANDGTFNVSPAPYGTWTPANTKYGVGYVNRACADDPNANAGRKWACANYSRSSSTSDIHVGSTLWLEAVKRSDILVIDHGTNDMAGTGPKNPTQLWANILIIINMAKSVNPNIKIIVAEIIPRVTTQSNGLPLANAIDYSTVNEASMYAVSVNQFTPANIIEYNTLIWTKYYDGTIDGVHSAASVRAPSNPQLLRYGVCSDGTHLTTLGAKLLAAALRLEGMKVLGKFRAWYDPHDSYNYTIATGVSQWKDKAGVNHAVQATTGNQPAIDTTYTGTSSDRAALVYSGGTMNLARPNAPIISDGIDYAFIMKPNGAGTNRFLLSESAVTDAMSLHIDTTNKLRVTKVGTGTTLITGSTTIADDTNYLVEVKTSGAGAGTSLDLKLNGVAEGNYASAPNFAAGHRNIGGRAGSSASSGGFGEYIEFVPNALTAADRASALAAMKVRAGM